MSTHDSDEEILYAFAAEPVHDQATLERYLKQYPSLATDFIDLLTEIRLANELPDPLIPRESVETVDAAFAQFIGESPTKSLATLFDRFRGQAFADLATAVNVPRAILTPIRDRLVRASTVPARFTARLAEAMGEAPATLRAYLDLSATSNPALNFSAVLELREPQPISFVELVESTEMNEEQRSLLRDDLRDDGHE